MLSAKATESRVGRSPRVRRGKRDCRSRIDDTGSYQTDSSSVGLLISTKAVQDLPLNGRNVIQLVELSAGHQSQHVQFNVQRQPSRRPASFVELLTANGQSLTRSTIT